MGFFVKCGVVLLDTLVLGISCIILTDYELSKLDKIFRGIMFIVFLLNVYAILFA